MALQRDDFSTYEWGGIPITDEELNRDATPIPKFLPSPGIAASAPYAIGSDPFQNVINQATYDQAPANRPTPINNTGQPSIDPRLLTPGGEPNAQPVIASTKPWTMTMDEGVPLYRGTGTPAPTPIQESKDEYIEKLYDKIERETGVNLKINPMEAARQKIFDVWQDSPTRKRGYSFENDPRYRDMVAKEQAKEMEKHTYAKSLFDAAVTRMEKPLTIGKDQTVVSPLTGQAEVGVTETPPGNVTIRPKSERPEQIIMGQRQKGEEDKLSAEGYKEQRSALDMGLVRAAMPMLAEYFSKGKALLEAKAAPPGMTDAEFKEARVKAEIINNAFTANKITDFAKASEFLLKEPALASVLVGKDVFDKYTAAVNNIGKKSTPVSGTVSTEPLKTSTPALMKMYPVDSIAYLPTGKAVKITGYTKDGKVAYEQLTAEKGAFAGATPVQTGKGKKLSEEDAYKLAQDAANMFQVNPNLLLAMARAESDLDPTAVSNRGAEGIMQIMPAMQKSLGVNNPKDPAQSFMGGAKFVSMLQKKYNTLEHILAAYNMGEPELDARIKSGRSLPAETRAYITKILALLRTVGG